MRKERLGDLCTIVSGGTPARSNMDFWNGGDIPWIKISNIKGKYVTEADEYITQAGLDNSSAKMLSRGTILYTIFATLGEVGILDFDACTNQAIAGITIKDTSRLLTDYLYYYLKAQKNYVAEIGRGVAQNNINMSILRNFEVPLPAMQEQHAIVELINHVEMIIQVRKRQLRALDTLIKARFVEMFGDTVLNPFGWKKESLGTVCDVRDGTHDSPQYHERGFPLVTSKNVTSGKIDLAGCSMICEADFLKINERSKVDMGDIIMPMIGTVGKPVIVNIEPLFAIKNVSLIKFRSGSKVLNTYIQALLQSDYFDDAVLGKVRGGTQKFISLGDIRKLEVLIPPLELQEQFAAFVSQVDKSKAVVQAALDKAQLLFDSLMQQYFG